MLLLRSLLFHALFYLVTLGLMILFSPVLILPRRWGWPVVPFWARTCLALLRWIVGLKVEVRGLENIPEGGYIVAAKHQSAWETFALLPLFASPTYVLKRELRYIPLFGWYTAKYRQIPVDRGKRSVALARMTEKAGEAVAEGRQILIFPEGTRRPAGAEPRYKHGVAHLYRSLECPVLPIALNSGVYWPRRGWTLYPGTVLVEILPPIQPGLELHACYEHLVSAVEGASDELLREAARRDPDSPVLALVEERWRARGRVFPRA
ncbi:1-acyl-sn-glycerol-3-phosphate acyltransferase [Stappia taiwanensis]|uniref:1-acyl-sn-glycerol-3-phosphate acyltransferase n=1 Tax=Stappia taiwanensis TaxID=992267 RepID=A0A838XWV8_9HYPH|nr:lysophospholipid acyltransferase family protein [Stappia taiwanensis]MBA4611524.1 1-acyl-sn-glycerol-3-phosphate acyltransferase [Stappia taiwanensis]GGE99585.1 1-acyl-sn-glycerol-3-phosphate acyltransferase [Stappia taiwanensis]